MNHDAKTLGERVARIRDMAPRNQRDAEIAKLRAEAEANQRHVAALEARKEMLLRQGKLKIGPEVKPDDTLN